MSNRNVHEIYGMELLFYLMDDIFQVLQSIINTFVVYNVAFDSL